MSEVGIDQSSGKRVTVSTTLPEIDLTSGRPRFRPDIQGLRTIAVVLVVLFHAGVPFLPGGYVGVDVFFVISGFLITGLLLRESRRSGTISFTSFYARRARRLLPMATTVLLATVIASRFLLADTADSDLAMSITSAATFWSNWFFGFTTGGYFDAGVDMNPVLHFWSLSVEEQFYVLWPLLLVAALLWSRRRNLSGRGSTVVVAGVLVAITGTSLIWSVLGTASEGSLAYYGLQTRLWELGFGALLAITASALPRVPRHVRFWFGWTGIALIAYAATQFNGDTVFPGKAALVPVVGACLVVIAGASETSAYSATRLLSTRPMQYVGARSYNLYLWHWPALVFTAAALTVVVDDIPEDGGAQQSAHSGMPALIGVAIACVLTVITFRLIEEPARRSRLLSRSRTALTAGAAAIVVTVICAHTLAPQHTLAAIAKPVGPRAEAIFAAANELLEDKENNYRNCMADENSVPADAIAELSENCVLGSRDAQKRIALIGDSHALSIAPAFDELGKNDNLRVDFYARGGCWYGLIGGAKCGKWNELVHEKIADVNYSAIILARSQNHGVDSDEPWRPVGEAAQAFDVLKASTDKLIILQDPPQDIRRNIPECLVMNGGNDKACAIRRSDGLERERAMQLVEADAAREAGLSSDAISWIQLASFYCPPRRSSCPAVLPDDTILYWDNNHLTPEASIAAVPWLSKQLDTLVPDLAQ